MEEKSKEIRIKELFELYKDGAITIDEYESLKANILNGPDLNKETKNRTHSHEDIGTTANHDFEYTSKTKHKPKNKPIYKRKWTLIITMFIIIVGVVLYFLYCKISPLKIQENYTETANGLNLEMVFVQGGTYTMGCTSDQGSDCENNEKPAHQVTLSDFHIGKYEVTQAQWQAVMGTNPSDFKGDNLPVENVSWNDSQEFIKKLNAMTGLTYRLPTEAEWEFAARGGNKSKGYKYSGSNSIDDVAWYSDNSVSTTHSVGTKLPNELGLYDISGNVWEWCQEWFGNYNSSSQTNPQGSPSGSYCVLRGGSWFDIDRYCRVSFRSNCGPGGHISFFGFRLVRVK